MVMVMLLWMSVVLLVVRVMVMAVVMTVVMMVLMRIPLFDETEQYHGLIFELFVCFAEK